ncbi:MAG: alanine:cation symporter family protein [Clostridia bacterium]|nr:alanine:cation symporter family protein [Clostridia bacterium]
MVLLDQFLTLFNNYFYSYILIILLLGFGLYFSFRTGFVQFRFFGEQIRAVTEKPDDKKSVSSFQALMLSTASRVGTGNIIGVSTALCLGGFGSVFWMWVVAIIGGALAFVESTLAQIFKKRADDGSYGGPAYYIEAVLKSRVPGIIFSILLIMTYGVGFNMLTSYNLQSTFSQYSFYNAESSPVIIGLITAGLVGFCLLGGGKGILNITSVLVPVMGVVYILTALIVVIMNFGRLPEIFTIIFKEAFDFRAIFGGFSGSCVMFGIKRGLLSNEAGVGSAPNASAAAEVSHPIKQGLVQMLSVSIDTLLICTATAFMCMCSGVEPSSEISGAEYVQLSVQSTLGSIGPLIITVAMALFAFTTLIGNIYYVDKCVVYITNRESGKTVRILTRVMLALLTFVGSVLSADLLWNIADLTMGFMIVINVPVIAFLSKYVFRALEDYEKQKKAGVNPVFYVKNITLPYEVDYWK